MVTEAKYTSQINLFILANGKIDEFTPENVALAIEDNKALYDEFMALKSWKQKEKKCIVLLKDIMIVQCGSNYLT